MFSTLLPFVVLATPVFSTILSNGTTPSTVTDDQLTCTTSFASIQPLSVITSIEAVTSTQIDTSVITYTPSISLTLQPTTLTVGEFATTTETITVPQVTDTFFSTSTVLNTTTITSTLIETKTDTLTTTITSSPAAISIATPAGFTPIASVVAGALKKRDECGPVQSAQPPITIYKTVTSTLIYELGTYYTFTKSDQLINQDSTTLKTFTTTTTALQYVSKDEEQSTGVAGSSRPAGPAGPAPSGSFSRHHYYNTTSRYVVASGSAPTSVKTIGTAISPIQNTTSSIYAPTGVTTSSRVSITPIISANSTISSGTAYSSSTSTPAIIIPSTSYPAFVDCTSISNVESTTTITETASSTITNLATPYVTETSTSTITTTTSVLIEDASTTLISTLFSTISSTVVATSTSTLTVTQTVSVVGGATPTTYAACAANNVISSVDGNYIYLGTFLKGILSSSSQATAYDCCVSCQTTSGCGGSFYSPINKYCYLNKDSGTCDGSISDASFTAGAGIAATGALYISNGPCGQVIQT